MGKLTATQSAIPAIRQPAVQYCQTDKSGRWVQIGGWPHGAVFQAGRV